MFTKLTRKLPMATAVAVALMAGSAANAQTVEFNASIWLPESHPLAKYSYVEWLPRLEEASGGTLKPTLFTGPVLLPPDATLGGLRDGIAHVAFHAGTYTPSDLPEDNVLAQLAFNYSDHLLAGIAMTEANMTIPALQDQWKRNGIVFLGGYATLPYNLVCSTPVNSPEDLKGLRIRVPGAAHSDWADAVGAVTVNVPSSEMYAGLDRGQLDCAAVPANDLQSRSLWEVAKYVNMVDLGVYWAGFMQGANRDFWHSLNDAQRQAFFDTIPQALVEQAKDYSNSLAAALEASKEHDVVISEPSEEMLAAVADFGPKIIDGAVALANDEYGVKEPKALIDAVIKIFEKWEGLLAGVDRSDNDAVIALIKQNLYSHIDASTYSMD